MSRAGIFALALICASAAQAGAIEKFYTSTLAPGDSDRLLPPGGEPKVMTSSGHPGDDRLIMFSRGYALIGYSSFEGELRRDKSWLKHARKVGAELVVVDQQFERTISGSTALILPRSRTSTTTGTVTTMGSGGTGFGSFSGTTTTQGMETAYLPWSVDRYGQTATFYAPMKRLGIGILGIEIPPQRAAALGTNKGVVVAAVRRESPAFEADILPGDVVKGVGDVAVHGPRQFFALVPTFYGKTVAFDLLRKGAPLRLNVTLPPDGAW